MNRIVREHYPVSKLPEDLRKEFPGQEEVTLTVEAVERSAMDQRPEPPFGRGHFSRFRHLARDNFHGMDEIVAHVRALRDEWDERDRLIKPEP